MSLNAAEFEMEGERVTGGGLGRGSKLGFFRENPFNAAALLNPLGLQHLQHRQQQHLSSDSMIEGGSEGKGGG